MPVITELQFNAAELQYYHSSFELRKNIVLLWFSQNFLGRILKFEVISAFKAFVHVAEKASVTGVCLLQVTLTSTCVRVCSQPGRTTCSRRTFSSRWTLPALRLASFRSTILISKFPAWLCISVVSDDHS